MYSVQFIIDAPIALGVGDRQFFAQGSHPRRRRSNLFKAGGVALEPCHANTI